MAEDKTEVKVNYETCAVGNLQVGHSVKGKLGNVRLVTKLTPIGHKVLVSLDGSVDGLYRKNAGVRRAVDANGKPTMSVAVKSAK